MKTNILIVMSAGVAIALGCAQGFEGDRCNPALSHDECNSGLSCQQPVNCPESYCCPTNASSSNPYCQSGCNGGDVAACAAGNADACAPIEAGGSDAGPG